MYSKPMILPLSVDGTLYVVQDESGETICTGTRDVCEVLMHIIGMQNGDGHSARNVGFGNFEPRVEARNNVRSAIVI